MAQAHDLTGQVFGHLKVIERGPYHVSKGGQKHITWLCECQLCGKRKCVSAQDLKRGTVTSCGCYRSYAGSSVRNRKICVVCGKEFFAPKSSKKVTCSDECRRKHSADVKIGREFSAETKRKISEKSKGRDTSEIQPLAVEAAKNSPLSGRFETNINALDWHLISPDGKHYQFHSLNFWIRKNCKELFGCEPDSREMKNASSGLSGAKRAMLGGSYGCATYKGWRVIPTDADIEKAKEISMKKEIEEFVKRIKTILGIDQLRIEYKPQDFFPTATMLAMCDSDGTTVYVRHSEDITPDLLFAVAHELRHCWQIKNKPEILKGYQESQDLTVEEYNLQPAEIDANAFAGAVMVDFFGIKPLFQGLPEKVKDKIYEEMKNIKK